MSRGKRYNNEPKLNIKKVVAVIIALVVIIMFAIAIKNLLTSDSSANNLVSTTYFLFNKNSKWGIIDNDSKVIIEPTYDEAIIIPNNKKDVFICNYDVDHENNTYKTKVLNSKGKEICTGYNKINALENYDENHNLWYEDNVLLVEKDGKYGLIDFEGKIVLDINYDKIETLKGTKNSLITIKNDSKKGLVNCSGQEIVENKYDEIMSLGQDTKAYIIKQDGKYGVNGILDCKYQEIKPLNHKEVFCVKEDGKYKVINQEEKEVLSEKFDDIETIKDNIIVYKNNGQYSAYDFKENKKVDKMYKELKYTANKLFIVRSDNNYGIINIDGEELIKQNYAVINYYEGTNTYELEEKDKDLNTILNGNLEEIAKGIVNETNYEKSYIKIWTEEGYVYYNLKNEKVNVKDVLTNNNLFLSKQNDKYGFVDKQGNVVVDYIYDDAKEQNEFGYIPVKKDGLWGSLDKQGKIICEPKYNLDNNLLVDFIGEYHLGVDINLMYYTNKF